MNFIIHLCVMQFFNTNVRAFNSCGITHIQLVFHSCCMRMSFILRIVETVYRTNSTAFISLINMYY